MRVSPVTLLSVAALSLLSAAAMAATVYKWVDEKGVTHYSDQPNPKATEVEVQQPQSYNGGNAARTTVASTPSSDDASASPYACEWQAPREDETFQNTSTVTARLTLTPNLLPGHRVVVLLDRRPQGQPSAARDFVLTNVERGEHLLVANVVNERGTTVCTTPAVRFFVHQPSRQSPVPTSRPRF